MCAFVMLILELYSRDGVLQWVNAFVCLYSIQCIFFVQHKNEACPCVLTLDRLEIVSDLKGTSDRIGFGLNGV